MIRKIVAVKNVGKFRNYTASGDVEFRKLTLLNGENGQGKTTLAAIFRSLQSGNPHSLLERRALSGSNPPEADVLLDSGMASFRNGAWSLSLPEIEVFDDTFVHENVYAGGLVDRDHKRNLYRIIVGEQGAQLAAKVDELDALIKNANRDIHARKAVLSAYLPPEMALDDFVALSREQHLDARIATLEADLEALHRAGEIKALGLLQPLRLPTLPPELRSVLLRDFVGVSSSAAERVQAHLRSCLAEGGQAWIAQGLGYARNDACPFCGQAVRDASLLQAYRAYFGESYQELKRDLAALQASLSDAYGERALLALQGAFGENRSLSDRWRQFLPEVALELSFDALQSAWESLRACAQAYVARKMAAPLEPIVPGPDFDAALSRYQWVAGDVDGYNQVVEIVNGLIRRKKTDTEVATEESTYQQLLRLRAIQQRYTPQVEQACRSYAGACRVKQGLELDKKHAKKKLDDYSADIFTKYQADLNELLSKFNAGFRIDRTTRNYIGGTPSSSYVLVIDGAPVELGNEKTPHGTPCFKTALSAGDRTTLALAFFLTRLRHDPRLSEKVIVLDDPITNQDVLRATCTRQLICGLCNQAKQVIVLAHNQFFLKQLWLNSVRQDVKTLWLQRTGEDSAVTEWDIETNTHRAYFQSHEVLTTYLEKGLLDRRHVARCIGLLVEEYLRFKLPRELLKTDGLGDFIAKVRAAPVQVPLHRARAILPEVEDLTRFSNKYQHREAPGADTEPINDEELRAYVKRTLDLVGRF
jgi:wobble nucleotide-excising tRNase